MRHRFQSSRPAMTRMMIRIGFGENTTSTSSARKPTPIARDGGPHDPAPVQRDDRQQIEQIEEESEEGDRLQGVRVGRLARDPDRGARASRAAVPRSRPSPRSRRREASPHRDHRAEERDEDRCAHGQSLSLRLEDVSHLVHEQEDDQADAEPPASEPDVERGGDEDREEELPLEERPPNLSEERAERDQRRKQLAQERKARLVTTLRRLVYASSASRWRSSGVNSVTDSWYPGGLRQLCA